MSVKRTWLRFDDVECSRCRRWAGFDGDDVWLVDGHIVCVDCATPAEKDRATSD